MTSPQGLQTFAGKEVGGGEQLLEARESQEAIAQLHWVMRTLTWFTESREWKATASMRRDKGQRINGRMKVKESPRWVWRYPVRREEYKQQPWTRRGWEARGESAAGLESEWILAALEALEAYISGSGQSGSANLGVYPQENSEPTKELDFLISLTLDLTW